MSKDTNAPQAFPYCGVGDELNYSKGMSLHDYFAAAALQGICAAGPGHHMTNDMLALEAYGLADAMIKARSL